MKVISLKTENYRNLKNNTIYPCDGVNVICGDNAQGKTNLLEAVWMFCGGHSFRPVRDWETVGWDSDFARLDMNFEGQLREQTARIIIAGAKKGGKQVKINGVEKKSSASLIERFCAVVFSPEHLNLIKRGPSERRKFIDGAICREKLKNAVIHSKYMRALNQRNSLLKEIYGNPRLEKTLGVWDEPLIKNGALLIKKRLEYIGLLSESAERLHSGISAGSENLKIEYDSPLLVEPDDSLSEIEKKLEEKIIFGRRDDIRLGVTCSGPHRDDVRILINGKNAKTFSSQGQQRSAVLSLKLAEAEVLRDRMGENPVILLDDVLSELDSHRQDFLLNRLSGCQVFITCCEKTGREQLENGKVFRLSKGEII